MISYFIVFTYQKAGNPGAWSLGNTWAEAPLPIRSMDDIDLLTKALKERLKLPDGSSLVITNWRRFEDE